ncbi:MAG: undecaprenyl-phosphate galactose phosphotransferase WbaP, partial [Planctomycetales bacterium]|nr:undecaprenyl-phosphate galactose phosphotransferase WbaP [Planctomycetales bacterium]
AAIGLQWLNPEDTTSRASVWLPPVLLAWVLVNAILGLYPGVCLGLVEEIRRLTLSLSTVALITLARLQPGGEWLGHRLAFVAVAYVICMFLAPVLRSTTRKMCGKFSWWGFPTFVCGNDTAALGVDQWLQENRRLGLRPLGVIADPSHLELDAQSTRLLGDWEQAEKLAEELKVYWAVAVESNETEQELDMPSAAELYLTNVPHVYVVSKLTGIPDHWNRHQMDEGLSGFLVEQHLLLPIPQIMKRSVDLVVATVASLFLIPLFAVLSVAIKITSPGPIFYGHERIGIRNTRFKAWKFRTMVPNADKALNEYLEKHPELRAEWERDHKLRNDPRVTPLGKWMRKWSIDELPQIWNVFCGEMSIVGPRPIVEAEIEKYGEHFETFCTVPPGITGLWQVCGRNDTTYEERVQLDLYYIHHWSPWMDFYLLARTFKTVLFTKGAY